MDSASHEKKKMAIQISWTSNGPTKVEGVGNPSDAHVATPRSIPLCDTWHASSLPGSPKGAHDTLKPKSHPTIKEGQNFWHYKKGSSPKEEVSFLTQEKEQIDHQSNDW